MKRIICLLLVVFGGLLANPIVPNYLFSELDFDEQNNWQLEIHSLSYNIQNYLDSVVISSSSGKSRVLDSVFINSSSDYYTIQNTPQFLSKPLGINKAKDTISITTYYNYRLVDTDVFTFGTGTAFPVIDEDMSIATFFYDFQGPMVQHDIGTGYSIAPSLGAFNDSTGNTCSLYGKIQDKNGNPICNKSFNIEGWPRNINTDNNGNYRIRLLARKHYFNQIYSDYWIGMPLVTPVELMMTPGYTYTRDFILDMVGISEQSTSSKSSALLYNYPNPFNNQTAIYYEVPEGLKYKNATIRISNIKGEAVAVLAANQKSGSVYWNADHNSAGMYIYQLLIDGKAVKSGEMVLLK